MYVYPAAIAHRVAPVTWGIRRTLVIALEDSLIQSAFGSSSVARASPPQAAPSVQSTLAHEIKSHEIRRAVRTAIRTPSQHMATPLCRVQLRTVQNARSRLRSSDRWYARHIPWYATSHTSHGPGLLELRGDFFRAHGERRTSRWNHPAPPRTRIPKDPQGSPICGL